MSEPNIQPFTKSDMINLFNSVAFRTRLNSSAHKSWNSDHEFGFAIGRDIFKNKLFYGQVVGTQTSGYGISSEDHSLPALVSESLDEILPENMSIITGEIYPLLTIHFHQPRTSFKPTENDLHQFIETKTKLEESPYGHRITYFPIEAIASQPTSDRNIEILLLQPTSEQKLIPFSIINRVESHPDFSPQDNESIVEVYKSIPELIVEMITYTKTTRGYKLNEKDKQKITQFAHTPTYLGSTWTTTHK